jgi:hypothetical protein
VLNYLEESNTHFINTDSHSSQRQVSFMMAVGKITMALAIVVGSAGLISMFNVV